VEIKKQEDVYRLILLGESTQGEEKMEWIIRVNMSNQKIAKESVPKDYHLLGGRGLIGAILNHEVKGSCHPLSENNKLIFAPGLLAGTNIPCSGRLSVGSKSPLTYGVKESNVGGGFAHKCARLGIKAILIEGKPPKGKLYLLFISKNEIKLEEVPSLTQLGNYDTDAALLKQYGGNVAIASIGPAGEKLFSASSVAISDQEGRPTRHAARGGLGAVMGSKGIKAIVLDDSGCNLVKPKNPESYKVVLNHFIDYLEKDPAIQSRSKYGTPEGIWHAMEAGYLPTRNFSSGRFEQGNHLDPDAILKLAEERGGYMTACMPGCIIKCSHVFNDRNKNFLTASLEYETLSMLGANLGIGDLDTIATMDRTCDDVGIDTIEMGGTLGILTETEFLRLGDGERALQLLNEIREGTLLGRILGQGVVVTGRVFGVDRIPAIKGQGIPAYDPRNRKTMGITLATSALGADHTAAWYVTGDTVEEQIQDSRRKQIRFSLMDTLGMCLFTRIMLLDSLDFMVGFFNSVCGITLHEKDLLRIGESVLKQEREFNEKAGFGPSSDNVPDFFREEPCPPTNNVYDVPEEGLRKTLSF
jgi:aldehyde:ferredoxin oxidoreductase